LEQVTESTGWDETSGSNPAGKGDSMRSTGLACSLLVFAFVGYGLVAGETEMPLVRPQASAPVTEPYIQVTSVTIEPSAIHKTQKPNTATVIVQVMLRGQAPPNPEAIVEVGTYSSDPPGINVKYENPTRTVSLKKDITVVKFAAEANSQTARGKLVVAATIGGATKGINIKDPPESPKDCHAELVTLDP
jgi:hypothetical protein